MTPYIQHEPTNMKGRGGVRSITVYMTNEERVRLVNSVYSNIKKLTIAQMLLTERRCTGERISEATGYSRSTISEALKEMEAVGVVTNTKTSYFRYYVLTSLGKKLLALSSL